MNRMTNNGFAFPVRCRRSSDGWPGQLRGYSKDAPRSSNVPASGMKVLYRSVKVGDLDIFYREAG